MKIEITKQDVKRIKAIRKLLGAETEFSEATAWTVISNALIEYQKAIERKGKEGEG